MQSTLALPSPSMISRVITVADVYAAMDRCGGEYVSFSVYRSAYNGMFPRSPSISFSCNCGPLASSCFHATALAEALAYFEGRAHGPPPAPDLTGLPTETIPAPEATQQPDQEISEALKAVVTGVVEERENRRSISSLSRESIAVDVTLGSYDSELEPVVRWTQVCGYGRATIEFTAKHVRSWREADRSIAMFSVSAEVLP